MSKFVFEVPSEMVAKAVASLEEKVRAELEIPDPADERAEAAIKANVEKE